MVFWKVVSEGVEVNISTVGRSLDSEGSGWKGDPRGC